MKYICTQCSKKFNEPKEFEFKPESNTFFKTTAQYNRSESRLVRYINLQCPFCYSFSISLTEKGKLMIERKAKIEKIENKKLI